MNRYTIDDIYVGMKESFNVSVTDDMMDSFLRITGDINPLHSDGEYARSKGYSDRVVFGMLTSSFLSTLAGVYLPGENSIIREVEVKFKRPVYVNEELTITGEVTEVRPEYGIFYVKVSMTGADGEKVLRGKMQIGVM